ncbi:MAG: site-specific DNA-methyltransferase [Chloroflexota bacterium]
MELDTIVCADALTFLKGIPDDAIDMALTSPPYDNLRTYKGYSWDFEGIAHELYRVLKPGGVLVWVVGDATVDGSETLTSFKQALYFKEVVGFRMHDTMIYQKAGVTFPESTRYVQAFEYMFVLAKGAPRVHNLLTTKTKYGASRTSSSRLRDGSISRFKYETKKPTRTLPNVWYIPAGFMKTTRDRDAFEHPAMFPEKLAERHILTWSNPGDVVLDPFGGSGTTAKMARIHKRHFLTCDISAEYCDLMRRRLSQPFTPDMFATIERQAQGAD